MVEKIYQTANGPIHYWFSKAGGSLALVVLPGLTADHRLFDKQVAYFEGKYSMFVWDAPGHAASWPFELTFSLMDKARWLDGILTAEGVEAPVIIGQSMGGFRIRAAADARYDGGV